jgi:CelD/BcsL family acetyltransferase involved in cellulose biosynthesis
MPTTYEVGSRSRDKRCSSSLRPVTRLPRQVFELNPLLDPRWQTFVNSHPDASVFHQVEWLRALEACYGYAAVALTLSPPGSPLENGLVLCEVRSRLTGNRLVSVPFSDHCEPLINDLEELELFVENLAERIEKSGWKYFELRPILHTPNDKTNLEISQNYYFHRLDLRPSEQTLFKTFHKDCVQRKIRRAEREALRYEEGTSETLLQHFYKLMITTRRRQGLPPQPLSWFRSLVTSMGKNTQIRVAFKAETPVASILTLTTKRSLVYKYGCSDSRFSNLGGTPLLFWSAIQQAKANGLEELDMGRSDIANTGLMTFKEHWGAKRSAVNYWRYPLKSASSNPERFIRYAKKLISVAPDQALAMLGNLLYRHVG